MAEPAEICDAAVDRPAPHGGAEFGHGNPLPFGFPQPIQEEVVLRRAAFAVGGAVGAVDVLVGDGGHGFGASSRAALARARAFTVMSSFWSDVVGRDFQFAVPNTDPEIAATAGRG